MSRGESNKKVSLEKYQESMKGIYSTSISKDTIDESPFCYKKPDVIEKAIEPTATIINRIKPVINIKSSEINMSWKEKRELMKKGKGKTSDSSVHRSDKEKDIRKSRKELRNARGKY